MNMEVVKSLLWEYRFVIVCAIAFLFFGLSQINAFKQKAYALMLQAKSLAKDAVLNSGEEQETWVIDKLYQFIPGTITIWIPRPLMQSIVHSLYHSAKDYLDNGKMDDSI